MKSILLIVLIMLAFFGGSVGSKYLGQIHMLAGFFGPAEATVQSQGAVIEQIKALSRLETVQYSVRDIVRVGEKGWFRGEEALWIVGGNVVAGIDLSKLTDRDVTISADGTTIKVNLPQVEIFSTNLDTSQTEKYDYKKAIFTNPNLDLDHQALEVGSDTIFKAACKGNIMQQATENGQHAMEKFLSVLRFEHVEVTPADVPSCEAPAIPQ